MCKALRVHHHLYALGSYMVYPSRLLPHEGAVAICFRKIKGAIADGDEGKPEVAERQKEEEER